MTSRRRLSSARSSSGSMLALIVATSIMLGAALLFACWYMASTSLFTAHVSAVEAAALAAAHDIGRIVVDTPEFGFVALCDDAPVGSMTKADDNYFTQVKSINEIMATTRLCAIIADEIHDPFVKKLAEIDRQNALKAKDALIAEINNSIGPGQDGLDAYGRKVSPYNSAMVAYLKNCAPKSKYVDGSLKLSLGGLTNGIATAAPLPKPAAYTFTGATDSIGGFYKSDRNIPYAGKDFVFAAVGQEPRLVEPTRFTATVAGLPYQMPAVVRVVARQAFGDDKPYTIDYAACANTGRAIRSPTPGALAYSFPDGPIWELEKPADLRTWSEMSKTADILTSAGGDFPRDKPAATISDVLPFSSPWSGPTAPCREVASCALYDWMRAGGAIVDVDSMKAMMFEDWNVPDVPLIDWKTRAPAPGGVLLVKSMGKIPAGIQHRYEFKPDGTVDYSYGQLAPQPYMVAGHNQLYAENPGGAGQSQALKAGPVTQQWSLIGDLYLPTTFTGTNPIGWLMQINVGSVVVGTQYFDMYVRDSLRQPGKQHGGKHEGTPCDEVPFVALRRANDFGQGGVGAGHYDHYKHTKNKAGKPTFKGSALAPLLALPNAAGSGVSNVLKGLGLPPMITAQDDFATTNETPRTYWAYSSGPSAGAPRPTYTQTGTVADIRFRREIDVGKIGLGFLNSTTGYIGEINP